MITEYKQFFKDFGLDIEDDDEKIKSNLIKRLEKIKKSKGIEEPKDISKNDERNLKERPENLNEKSMITKFKQLNEDKLIPKNKLNETILNPNFSIVVPGGCNGSCDFCFWKQSKVCENYTTKLVETLNSMPSQFYQLSLTGGEPSLSPYLNSILESIDRKKWTNTVLTSNGTNLLKFIPKLKGKIDHVNISRHHYDDEINESVFKTSSVPNSDKLKILVKELNKVGIDVTYSAVITEGLNDKESIEKFIKYANSQGVYQVFLRKQHGTLDPSEAEKAFEHLPSESHDCPVCRNTTQKIGKTTVVWKASLEEPSKELGMIYEVVYNENGVLTSDWEQEFEINTTLIKDGSNSLLEDCGGSSSSGCGGSSSSSSNSSTIGCGIPISSGCGGSSNSSSKSSTSGCGSYTSSCGSSSSSTSYEEEEEDEDVIKDRKKMRNRKKKLKKLKNIIKSRTLKPRPESIDDNIGDKSNKSDFDDYIHEGMITKFSSFKTLKF